MTPTITTGEGLMAGRRRPLRLGHAQVTLCDVAILSWRVDARRLQTTLPEGLEPLVHDGTAWSSAVMFRNRGLRPARLGLPRLACSQLNVRSYLRDPDSGEPGPIWFHGVIVSRRWLAWISRWVFGVPCRSLPIAVGVRGTTWSCEAADGSVAVRAHIDDAVPQLAPDLLDLLTNPHTAYVPGPAGRGLRRWSIWHPPQSLRALRVEHCAIAPLEPLGLATRRPDLAFAVAAVPYEVYFPTTPVDLRARR